MAEKQNIKLRCPKCGKRHTMSKEKYQTLETKEIRIFCDECMLDCRWYIIMDG